MNGFDSLFLFRELEKDNVWWSGGIVSKDLAREFKRSDYFSFRDRLLESDYVNIIIGPRRVGKSTMLYQLVDYLINERKIPKNRILFASLERAAFDVTVNPVKSALAVYEEYILKESLADLSEPIYVFLDETSRRANWALEVKEYVDRKYKIKFFVTGSSSPALFQKSSESLVGRHNKNLMLSLKYTDTLRLKNIPEIKPLADKSIKKDLRASFLSAACKGEPEKFFKALKDAYVLFGPSRESIMQRHLTEYLSRGGFPEFYDKNMDWQQSSKILREAYFDAIISFDVMRVFGSRNPEKLKALYTYLALSTAQIVNYSSLSRDLGISRNALDEYVSQLEQTFLIHTATAYRKNRRHVTKDIKKVYVGDVGFRNAVLNAGENEMKDPALLGHLAETAARDHAMRLKYCLEPNEACELFFWKDKQKKEVDIVGVFAKKPIPIEVKYQENIRGEDYSSLKVAVHELESPFGILITKNSLAYKEKMITMPMWMWMVMC